ncbi:MAG: hypothetical protein U5N55_10065 [Cypionkella sp.]|nr:hypothetical protein [Cypionkella sp.]
MEFIADILMTAGSFGAAVYCYVLSNRLKRFTTLESGMGSAIAVLSVQVDDMTRALEGARSAAHAQSDGLRNQTQRAEAVMAQLQLLMAALHDLPKPEAKGADLADDPDGDRKLRFVRRRNEGRDLEAAE